ncbi:37S ribosomal protein RSM22 [Seminavis robusta]|uniref:37S ribosomal protein RSM22 n=1 Tax=Seminavis robusta TaxID=568900 RepID=A0A9N8DBW5_9STRA|nr:37S ribosomal protein RSM22 [Seminavis robusta]|eukprot:Sro23_g015890.1 37S ribosomal protein RSM22 (628) ;mRNA; f:97137-99167
MRSIAASSRSLLRGIGCAAASRRPTASAAAASGRFNLDTNQDRPTSFFCFHRTYETATSSNHDNNDDDNEDHKTDPYEMDDMDDDSDYDDDDDDDSHQPWKTLLELPARAVWRAADPHPPDTVRDAQATVLTKGAATAKQLRRTFTEITVAHRALGERRERERRRMLHRTGHYSKRAQQRDDEAQPVLYGRLETLASLRNRLHPNYAITKRVLEETKSLLQLSDNSQPRRIIDMGMGVGSASAAAMEVFQDDIEWIHGIDPSRCMRECAKEFLEEIIQQQQQQANNNTTTRLTLTGSIASEASSVSTFDLALFTYTATELPHVASTLAAAAILWQKLAHNGLFVMIEPGTPDGFNSTRAVRNMLLDCCPPPERQEVDEDSVEDECHIIAPCTHNGICPMERLQNRQPTNDPEDVPDITTGRTNNNNNTYTVDHTDLLGRRFCSFVQTMSSGSHLNRGEKFSYLVAQKRVKGQMTVVENNDNKEHSSSFENERLRDLLATVYESNYDPESIPDTDAVAKRQQVQNLFEDAEALKAKYLDSEEDDLGLELLQGDRNRASHGRIIQAPLKKKGHVYIDYCANPGRLMRTRVSKALDYSVAPGLFTAARKSRWGGLWPDVSSSSEDDSSKP